MISQKERRDLTRQTSFSKVEASGNKWKQVVPGPRALICTANKSPRMGFWFLSHEVMMTSLATGPFRGRFEIKLDPKGRLSLPPSYRQNLAIENASLIITNSRYRGKSCLHAYSLAEWEKLERKISKLSTFKPEVQAFNRFYLSGGQASLVDAQNRILVPQSLRKFASLEASVILVGLGEKFEIWSEAAWNSIYDQLTESFEDTLNVVAGLDVPGGDGEK
jgi:MraZ protein